MRLLHAITTVTGRLIWGHPYGRNGRPLGPNAGSNWDAVEHIYALERGVPPEQIRLPIPDDGQYATQRLRVQRSYWNPWRVPQRREWGLTPLCGRIRTQSQFPSFSAHDTRWGPPSRRCRECVLRAAGQEVTSIYELNRTDPWAMVPQRERPDTVDPVSGL